jgi:hypothetical protein
MNATPKKQNKLTKEQEEELEIAIASGDLERVKMILQLVNKIPSKYLTSLELAHSYARKGAQSLDNLKVYSNIKKELNPKISRIREMLNWMRTKKNSEDPMRKLTFGGKQTRKNKKIKIPPNIIEEILGTGLETGVEIAVGGKQTRRRRKYTRKH